MEADKKMQTKLESLGVLLISLGIILIAFNPGTTGWNVVFDSNSSVLLVNMPKIIYSIVGGLGFVTGLLLIISEIKRNWAKRAIKIIKDKRVSRVVWIIFIGNYVVNCARWVVALNNAKVAIWIVTFITFVVFGILIMLIYRAMKSSLNKNALERYSTLSALKATAIVFSIAALAVVVFKGNDGVASAVKYLSIAVILLGSTLLTKEKRI